MPFHPEAFHAGLKSYGIPIPTPEFRFWPDRKWRFDYCWTDKKIALEVDGSIWAGGRHNRGSGWMKDKEKLNCAVIAGYRVLHCTPQELVTHTNLTMLQAALGLPHGPTNPKNQCLG